MSSRPKVFDAGVPHPLELGRLRDVSRNAQGAPSAPLDLGGDRLDIRGAPAGDDDVGARVGQAERDGAADAAGAADDNGKAAGKIEQSGHLERASCAGERRPFRAGDGGEGRGSGSCA